jgi:hypothetical protein
MMLDCISPGPLIYIIGALKYLHKGMHLIGLESNNHIDILCLALRSMKGTGHRASDIIGDTKLIKSLD